MRGPSFRGRERLGNRLPAHWLKSDGYDWLDSTDRKWPILTDPNSGLCALPKRPMTALSRMGSIIEASETTQTPTRRTCGSSSEKADEVAGIEKRVYGNVLALMTVFAEILSLVNVNPSGAMSWASATQIIILNLATIGSFSLLSALIIAVVQPKGRFAKAVPRIVEYSSAEKPLNIANWSRGYCA